MQIFVELYDKEPVENILAACVFKPDLVIYICDCKDNTMRKEKAVFRLFHHQNMKTQARFYYIDTANVSQIERLLRAIVHDYPNCTFNFSGGKDLVLLTAGVFCEKNNIPAFYLDAQRGRFLNLRDCTELQQKFAMPKFTAQDVFSLAGAKMIGSKNFAPTQQDKTFLQDAEHIFKCILRNTRQWNAMSSFFQAANDTENEGNLYVDSPQKVRVSRQTTARCYVPLLKAFAQHGIVEQLKVSPDKVQYHYKNAQIKKNLQINGVWLELYVYRVMQDTRFFDDVRTSVIVDWNSPQENISRTTRNEIDVFATKGIVPVFISCKMGVPTPLALSEIKILSEKFGGAHAKTVLVTASDVRKPHSAIAQRALDLGVHLLDKNDILSPDFARKLCELTHTSPT